MPLLGALLHNKRVSTVVRRVVLQAVLRPVVEFDSPVWVPAATDLAKLEQVQTAVHPTYAAWSRVAVTWQMTSSGWSSRAGPMPAG